MAVVLSSLRGMKRVFRAVCFTTLEMFPAVPVAVFCNGWMFGPVIGTVIVVDIVGGMTTLVLLFVILEL